MHDPDDDLAMLSRQLLRTKEQCDRLQAENVLLRAVAEASKADLNTVATMPWCRLDRSDDAPTCVTNQSWVAWIYGTHDRVHAAIAALDAGKVP